MEEMDIEMVVDIPDSPDRMGACHISDAARTGRDSNSSVPGHSRDSTVMKEERFKRARDRGGLVSESGLNGRLHLNFRKNVTKGIESGNRSIGFSPLENANTSQTAPLFRRTAVDNNSRNENTSIGALHMDRGKATSTKFPSKAFTRPKRNAFIGSNKQSGHEQLLEMAFPRGASRSSLAEGVKEGQGTACVGSSLPGAQCSLKVADNTSKGKEKIGNYMYEGAGLASDAKGIDLSRESQDKMDKQISLSHQPVVSPRITGQKRLVRNGCISPHLIAATAKLLAQDDDNSREADNFDQSCAGNVVSNNQTLKDIREIVADENISDRVKGKRVVHPHTSRERDTKIIHLSNSPNTNDEEASGTSDANGYAVGFSKGLGGWGSTRSRHYEQLSERAGHPFGRNNMNENAAVGRDNRRERNDVDACNNPIDLDATQTGYRRTPDLVPSREHCHFSKSFVRRQQKNGLNSENHGASSRMVVNDPEIVFLCSSGESSSSRCSRIHNRQCQGMSDPVLEIDGSPPDVRLSYSERFGCANNEEADARARQVEADERLARELQEQLYQEVSVFESNEIDENVAWALQQEEDALHVATTQDHRPLHHRTSSIPHPRRQPRSQSSRSSSNSRVNLAQAPTSVRMRQLRGSMFSRSPAASSRVRNLRFPSHMDLDMRLDILEALEAAVGELSDSMGTNSHILQIQRDFNENDYEMLLALDENNDQHVGASVNQINSLPQSTVQTGNFGEDCAICLETPTVGEAIRHLPCLHKFHKDCIDPWLSRRTSCPVCKSSINLN